jgi:MFS transporter, FHS family, L-fucose permease
LIILLILLILPSTVTTVSGKIPYINGLFLTIAVILVVTGIIVFILKEAKTDSFEQKKGQPAHQESSGSVWTNKKLMLGFAAIIVALGAESGIFGLYRNYVEDPAIGTLGPHTSYILYTVYFAMFALGRLIGAYIQKRIQPAVTLISCVIAAMVLLLLMMTTNGTVAVVSITFLGLFISIFFPTLYAISIEGMGKDTALASGLLTMGFLGAAILPVLQGKLADLIGLKYSFLVSLFTYCYILYFAFINVKKTEGNAKNA